MRDFEISRFGVMKHLNILEAASHIVSQRDTTNRRLSFDPGPIKALKEGWLAESEE